MAMMFLTLIAFVGLAADGALVYTTYVRLRRGVDSAALSVASQLREAQGTEELDRTAEEALRLQGFVPTSMGTDESVTNDGLDDDGDGCIDDPTELCYSVEQCISDGIGNGSVPTSYTDPLLAIDPGVCTYPPRKLIRVTAATTTDLAFMYLFGWQRVRLDASAISEAAAIDVVLVLDLSYSMTYESQIDGLDDDQDGCAGDETDRASCGDATDSFDNDGDGCTDEPSTAPCTGVGEDNWDDWLGAPNNNHGKVRGNVIPPDTLPDSTPNCTTSNGINYDPIDGDASTNMLSTLQAANKLPADVSADLGSGSQVIGPLSVCRPFEYVRDAALRFVRDYVQSPYDRVGVVTFASAECPAARTYDYCDGDTDTTQKTFKRLSVGAGTNKTDIYKVLSVGGTLSADAGGGTAIPLTVSAAPPCHGSGSYQNTLFPNLWYGGEPAGGDGFPVKGALGECENTDTGEALALALDDLSQNPRSNAVRFIILLSDGAASNTPYQDWDGLGSSYYACPIYDDDPTVGEVFYLDESFTDRPCQDGDARFSHDTNNALYDADDYARDQAEAIADEKNILMFAIGLGPNVTLNPDSVNCLVPYVPADILGNQTNLFSNPDCAPNGEQLLRYVADKGDGINDVGADPCLRDDTAGSSSFGLYLATIGESCGNYFYASGGVKVKQVFDQIAQRIFTRLTQ